MKTLIIDDDEHIARTLAIKLEDLGFDVQTASTVAQGVASFRALLPEVVLLDLRLPDGDGLGVLEELLAIAPETTVVMITAHGSVDTAVEAMRKGAFDYLQKPFGTADVTRLARVLRRVRRLESEVRDLRDELEGTTQHGDFITRNAELKRLLDMARQVAESDAGLLVTGESGTGKGLLAQLIHSWSPRSARPCITVDCTLLQEALLESDLFGHVKGAFTGATRNKKGKLLTADGGTLFLDEIGDLPLPLQAKLLRFLQSHEFEAVGDTKTRQVDVRIIAATNHSLEEMVAAGSFRQDLYFRLNVVGLAMPPLCARRDDVDLLVEHYAGRFAQRYGKPGVRFSREALDALRSYDWPGNVRELVNVVERGVVLTRTGLVTPELLPALAPAAPAGAPALTLREVEREHIRRTLLQSATLEEAATTLGIDPTTLWRKRKKYDI